MKKLSVLSFALLSFLVFGCGESEEPKQEPQLEGTWNLQEAQVVAVGTATIPGSTQPIPVGLSGEGDEYDLALTFNEDPNEVSSIGTFVLNVAVNASGIPLGNESFPVEGDEAFSGTWSRTGDQILIVDEDQTVEFTILELTDNRLRVSGLPDFEAFQVDGVTIQEASAEFLFVR